jgi:lysophospholipase L1-like esterase
MSASRALILSLVLPSAVPALAACSPPTESEPARSGGTGNEAAAGGASGTGIGGGAGAATSGTGGAQSTGGSAGSAAGERGAGLGGNSGVSGAGGSSGAQHGGAGSSGSGGGAAGVTGGGASGTASGGTAGTVSGGSGGTTSGGSAGKASGGSGGRGGAGSSGAAGAGGAFGVCNGATPARAVTIYVVGDSTASVYASNLYPRMGWGQPLQDLFATRCAVVRDVALSGRSSKSFIDEGAWTPVKNGLVAGDVVLVQFGHNDEKDDDPARYTEPQTTFKQYLTTYVDDTRAKQATPVLLTPVNRNSWSGTTLSNTHGAYPDAMRQLAASLSVSLIDMTALTKTYFERIGQAATAELFLILVSGESPNYPSGVTDNTHFQEAGARKLGQLVTYDAYRQRLPFATYLKAVPVAP